jgi:hypothetical protein
VNKVAQLYEQKSKLCSELSYLVDDNFSFGLGRQRKDVFNQYGASAYDTPTIEFLAEIKLKTIEHIKEQIQSIDKQLEQL